MAFALFTQIFCCCRHPKVEVDDSYNEESHLIPQTDEPPIIYGPDTVRIDHGKLQERLGHIVRAKEGKMVNVASHIPFNLHNQVIPPEPHSISRSASGSMDTREERQYNPYYEYHSNRDSEQQPRHKFTTSGYPYGRSANTIIVCLFRSSPWSLP
ncbi:hypothetical protein CPB84DRAFT_1899639 [Gymnopilus junonius]|uniref:Uncharacterized protein n=1 Tax=Gymnopilus junonius TaxID=109634 RepID=A0A9P5TGG8_GYMJU|nr:hypothetical protein CPB84DRAFT_1899639 [Gymnopilus junonius]